MQKKLEDKGYLLPEANTGSRKAMEAKEQVLEVESLDDLARLSQSLDKKIESLNTSTGGTEASAPASGAKPAQVSRSQFVVDELHKAKANVEECLHSILRGSWTQRAAVLSEVRKFRHLPQHGLFYESLRS